MTPRHTLCLAALLLAAAAGSAQTGDKPFKGRYTNSEYGVYICLDAYDAKIIAPDREMFGPLPGYLGKQHNSFCWLITEAKLRKKSEVSLSLINDYGSEDLTATLTQKDDSTFVLRCETGSPLKVPNKGKWQKLPKELTFKWK